MQFKDSPLAAINSDVKARIVKSLFRHPAPMSERELAAVVQVSHMSVNRTLRELLEKNLVKYSTVGKAHVWSVNQKSYVYEALLPLLSANSNIATPIEDLTKMIRQHLPESSVQKVILFGSVAKGEERSDSDIDLFVLVKGQKEKIDVAARLDDLVISCLERYGNRLAPYVVTAAEYQQKKDTVLFKAIESGLMVIPGRQK